MRILYIHGLSSSGATRSAATLRRLLPDATVFSPDLPIDPDKALEMLRRIVADEKIDIAVGTSMGGMFAQKLRGTKKILVNPAFHVSRTMRRLQGVVDFLNRRADGATKYEITPELCDRYELLEHTQFDALPAGERDITVGLFGTEDETVDCSSEFMQHYTRMQTFCGGHRLTEEVIETILLPLVLQLAAE